MQSSPRGLERARQAPALGLGFPELPLQRQGPRLRQWIKIVQPCKYFCALLSCLQSRWALGLGSAIAAVLALLMGTHPRLGARSVVRSLPNGLLQNCVTEKTRWESVCAKVIKC